eukprot:5458936-Alexandrium_andersonii.AAC.1
METRAACAGTTAFTPGASSLWRTTTGRQRQRHARALRRRMGTCTGRRCPRRSMMPRATRTSGRPA